MTFGELLDVLYEDNHLLAVNKPAGWATAHGDDDGDTIHGIAQAYLKEKYQKPGNVFLGVVHRLDKPVSGALLFARTSKAAARLSEQFRDRAADKVYWGVVERGKLEPGASGTFEDWLFHNDAAHRVEAVSPRVPGAKSAKLFYSVTAVHERLALLELRPQTGRKHQIRVQLAERAHAIDGDQKYGSSRRFGDAIALHARSLTVLHPISSEPLTFVAPLPKTWRGRFAHLLAETPA